jgi:hypothetical protein
MYNEYLKSIWLVLPITLVTVVLEILVMSRMPKSAGSSLGGTLFGFLILGLGFGFLAILAYHWVGNRWHDSAAQVYLLLAIGSAVLLSILAFSMHFVIKSPWSVVALWTSMNFLWGLGYGWFLPRILSGLSGS